MCYCNTLNYPACNNFSNQTTLASVDDKYTNTNIFFISFSEETMMSNCLPNQLSFPLSAGSPYVASQSAAAQAAEQAAAQEQLAEKAQENKITVVGEDQQRLIQHVLQQNLLAMATQLPLKIKLNNRGELFYCLQKIRNCKHCLIITFICSYIHYKYKSASTEKQDVEFSVVSTHVQTTFSYSFNVKKLMNIQ